MEELTDDLPEFIELRKYWDLMPNREDVELTDEEIRQATSSIHCVGPYFWFISDFRLYKPIVLGGQVEKFTGYTEQEVLGASLADSAFKFVSATDLFRMAYSGRKFWKYFYNKPIEARPFIKSSYSYTFHRKDKSTFHALHQASTLKMDAKGNATFQFDLVQDISHFNPQVTPRHFIIDSSDPKEVKRIQTDLGFRKKEDELLSSSELKILSLVKSGRSSKEIADQLSLSVHTINTHRKNMLNKAGAQNSMELLNFAVVNNLL